MIALTTFIYSLLVTSVLFAKLLVPSACSSSYDPASLVSWEAYKKSRDINPEASHEYQVRSLAHRIGQTVRKLRKEAGLTQGQLAYRMDSTQPAIARLEGGGSLPSLETLVSIAHACDREFVYGFVQSADEKLSLHDVESAGRMHNLSYGE